MNSEDIKRADDILMHFGIKGMKWGVRKERSDSKDLVLNKGTTLYNISGNTPRNLNGKVYTAHLKEDVVNYRANYASALVGFRGADTAFSNSFTVSSKITAAGRNSQIEAVKKLWENDKDGFAMALAQTKADQDFSAAFVKRVLKKDHEDKYFEKYSKKGEKWVATRGTQRFVASLGTDHSPKEKAYIDYMKKRGYNAIVDLNDTKAYGSKEPLLVFHGKTSLKKKSSIELTKGDIKKAFDAYMDKKKFDAYSID